MTEGNVLETFHWDQLTKFGNYRRRLGVGSIKRWWTSATTSSLEGFAISLLQFCSHVSVIHAVDVIFVEILLERKEHIEEQSLEHWNFEPDQLGLSFGFPSQMHVRLDSFKSAGDEGFTRGRVALKSFGRCPSYSPKSVICCH